MKSRLRVREAAAEKRISMTKLSQRSEVNYQSVRNMFRNPYAEVYVSTLTRLAQVLEVPTSSLIEDVTEEAYTEELAAIKAQKKSAPE